MTGIKKEQSYNEDMRGITTTTPVFEDYRNKGFVYVDKTRFIHSLVSDNPDNFFFISRPRRFGKSLFCHTLHSLFEGRKELFKGLYIEDKYSFEPFPVLHFNFARLSLSSLEWFKERFAGTIKKMGADFDIALRGEDPAFLLEQLLYGLYAKTGKKAVIIVDEYDYAITRATTEKLTFADEIHSIFTDFYSTVKNCIEYIHFFFMTGVVKLANLSVFSALNNLNDLSMNAAFADAFGYTEEELTKYFGEGIDDYLKAYPEDTGFRTKIMEFYDGYRFSPASKIRVYNPFSISNFFGSECRFDTYWDDTSSSEFAVKLAMKTDLSRILNAKTSLYLSDFKNFDISVINSDEISSSSIAALMYYAGYLTIERMKNENEAILDFPNNEVSAAFSISLLRRYSKDKGLTSLLISDAREAARNGDTKGLIKALNEFYDQVSAAILSRRLEQPYQLILHMFFIAAGCRTFTELGTKLGRIDNSMEMGNHIYLFELKVDQLPWTEGAENSRLERDGSEP